MKFTVFGASGFIGSNLVEYLLSRGHEVATPDRGVLPLPDEQLGHVIYAIGLTGNFRNRPYDTINSHVEELLKRMKNATYDSWLYLSSTRVYSGSNEGTSEADPIHVTPGADGIYDISKLLGESICLGLEDSKVRVARLSNVYGKQQSKHTFLGSLLEDMGAGRSIVINEGCESSKDYVAITDVVALIEKITLQGQHRIYNIASGMSFSHSILAKKLSAMTNLSITFKQGAPQRAFPRININRIIEEFGYKPKSLLEGLSELIPSSTH